MTRKRCTGKALAERRRRTFQLYLAEFTQEEIAEKVGVHRSVVSRDLQWIRDSILPRGIPRRSGGVLHPDGKTRPIGALLLGRLG